MQSIKTWAGIDVSADTLAAHRYRDGNEEAREFSNDSTGHQQLVKWLGKSARVAVEATGIYHLQLALTLRKAGVEVMVVNPRVAKDFARALSNRSKTDEVDAWTLLEFLRRMEFVAWEAPREAVLELRELGRRLTELVRVLVEEKNRLHAKRKGGVSKAVRADVEQHIKQLAHRINTMEKAAVEVILRDADLLEHYQILIGVPGIARRTAVLLLTELAVLDPTMSVRQLVAHAGLDPRTYESGTSVHRAVRISKQGNARIRSILYMNALSAIRNDRGARRFYAILVARGKKRMQAVVAVMRKLLHGIWIVMQRRIPFDSSVLFAASLAQAGSSDSAVAADQPQPDQDHPQGRSAAEELPRQLDPVPAEATPSRKKRSKAA